MEAIVVIGAVIALEMVIGSVGVPRATPVIEQTQDDFRQLPLINRETPPSLETDAPVNDREQLTFFRNGAAGFRILVIGVTYEPTSGRLHTPKPAYSASEGAQRWRLK
jgi:hypothetical protein